jgi:hypothetical protein
VIALVTVAVFIYRKPFAHLFSAVGYGTIGSTERAEYSLREAGHTFRRSTLDAATAAVPGMASYRAARWARRHPGPAAAAAAGVAAGAAAGVAAGSEVAAEAAAGSGAATGGDAYASRLRPDAPPPVDADGESATGRRLAGTAGGAGSARLRNAAEADGGSGRTAPPLDLPPRGASRASAARAGGSRPAAPRPAASASAGPASASPASASTAPAGPAPAAPRLSGAGAPASGWSRGAGRSAASSRPRAASPGPLSGPATPVRGRAGGSSGSSGSGSSGSGPAWPASGWPTAGARQRSAGSAGRVRPNPAPSSSAPGNGAQPPADQGGNGGGDKDQPPATPFWLRPIRRDK